MKRNLLIVCNPSRKDAVAAAVQLEASLSKTFDVFTISDIDISGIKKLKISDLPEIEVGIVLGGDGTTLRAAEVAHLRQVPLLGVNLGHVGFLSEVEESNIADVISAVLEKSYVMLCKVEQSCVQLCKCFAKLFESFV